jgi:uncharacterized protein with HEPN domain
MERLPQLALADTLDSITHIENHVDEITIEKILDDWLLVRAVERGLEIISEASRRIPQEWKEQFPDIPWSEIAGIGNILRHEYHNSSHVILWNTIKGDLPPLKKVINLMIEKI